jgi:hypothetical protein
LRERFDRDRLDSHAPCSCTADAIANCARMLSGDDASVASRMRSALHVR